jgi:hypothetical protein
MREGEGREKRDGERGERRGGEGGYLCILVQVPQI